MPRLVRLTLAPELVWVRERDRAAAASLTEALVQVAPPFTVVAPPSLAVTAAWAPGRQALWVHLLNVSAFYTGEDTGFRGIGREAVYAGAVASDAQIAAGGKVRRVSMPATDVALRFTGLQPKAVRLGLSGQALPVAVDGTVRIPHVDVHEVVVVDLAGGG